MKLGVRCNPLHLKSDFPGLMQWLSANGFDSADLMAPVPEQKTALAAANLIPGSFDCPAANRLLTADEGARREALAALKGELGQAAELGLRTYFACFVPEDQATSRAENFEIWKNVFPEVADYCESLGIVIAMEPWPGVAPHYATLGTTPEQWRAMFQVVPSRTLGLCYDPSHMARLGIDYLRVLGEFGHRIHHVHAKDCAFDQEALYLSGRMPFAFGKPVFKCSEGWWRYCIPGDGVVDWRKVILGLIAWRYRGVVSVELEDGVYMDDEAGNRRGLCAARDYLRGVEAGL